MKKAILLIMLSAVTITISSQTDSSEWKKNRWEIGIFINSVDAQISQGLLNTWQVPIANYYSVLGDKKNKSYSIGLTANYRLRENLGLRFDFGYTTIDLRKDYNAVGDTISQGQGQMFGLQNFAKTGNIKQKILRLAPSIEFTFYQRKFFSVHCGGQLVFNYYQKLFWNDSVVVNDLPGRSAYYESETPGGFSAGIGVFIGMRARLTQWISVGFEITNNMVYYNLGGKETGIMNVYYPTSPTEHFTWSIQNNRSTGVEFTKPIPSLGVILKL